MSGAPRVVALTLLALLLGDAARAVETRTWTAGSFDLESAQSDGVAVTSLGRILLAPTVARIDGDAATLDAAHVWAIATDARGVVYLGTGPDGRVLRLPPSGPPSTFFTADEPMVTALALLPDGDLLAATAPGGTIYRIRPDGKGAAWCKTDERYVWTLAVGAEGTVFAGTGERGRLLRIDRSGAATILFDSDESHLTALAVAKGGAIVAGGADRGVVYRIEPGGAGAVLLDADMAEVSDLQIESDGSVLAALIAAPEADPRPPAVRIRLPHGAAVGSSPESVARVEEAVAPTIEGIIEGLGGTGDSRAGRRVRGKVVRIALDGAATELWTSPFEGALCLALDADGRPLFGTGEPARIRRIEPDGEITLVATLREAQVSALLPSGAVTLAATSNAAAAYRIERAPAGVGSLVSRPVDALSAARWGAARWRVERGDPGGVQVEARTGSRAEPDSTWSRWGPPVTVASGGSLGVPDGRFLQWRVRLAGDGAAAARIGEISFSYVPYNRAPAVEGFRLDGGSEAAASQATFRWTASDADGDPVRVRILYRRSGTETWKEASAQEGSRGSDGSRADDSWKDGKLTWSVAELPEGAYEIRAIASDQSANGPGEGAEVAVERTLALTIDRTPPAIELRRFPDGSVAVTALDAATAVRRLEIVEGDRVLYTPRPEDGVCDAPRETFRIAAEAAGSGDGRKIRVIDAAANETTVDVPPR